MDCPNCRKEVPVGREICPGCYYPVKKFPFPRAGKIRFGAYDWYVLDRREDRALIITEKVIEKRAHHGRETEIAWETCDMRGHLNGAFYHSFGTADRARIIQGTNENKDNPWYGTPGGNPTDDRIFCSASRRSSGISATAGS